ncbi:hypothetical protein PV433_16590 [Paenibacillus sp. GYB004]|uniref:hypothetical protein n=1 Tax=Paenibacillus sp. GYB004 TaxID=2994393 RepID=UPI002F96D276
MRFITGVCILLLLLTGCTEKVGNPVPESEQQPAAVTVTPVDLFKGEAAKFQPFLGAMSGAFRLHYEGNKPNASLDIGIWQNGRRTASLGSVGDLFLHSADDPNREVEVIISMEPVSVEGKQDSIRIKVSSGSSLVTFTAPWDEQLTARGVISFAEPRSFPVEGSVHVWGMQGTSNNEIHTADFSPESLSRLERAIIFTLRFEQ